ncbi:MAG: hypothetical protein WCL39_04440, partial [Armatimonadota bacterium]
LQWAAKCTFSDQYEPFIVTEGCELHPSGLFWRRSGDLGNGVQEGEIVKVLRLVIGIDDNNPKRLQIAPRMPLGWTEISIKDCPALIEVKGQSKIAKLAYTLRRSRGGLNLGLRSDKLLGDTTIRLGPFAAKSQASKVTLNGKRVKSTITRSGDSWWVRVTPPSGAKTIQVQAVGR